MTTEAEKLAIHQAFSDELAGTDIMVAGVVSPHGKTLAAAGAAICYKAFLDCGWTVDRGPASAVDEGTMVSALTGLIVMCEGIAWNYPERLAREGAEAIVDRLHAKGWAVV